MKKLLILIALICSTGNIYGYTSLLNNAGFDTKKAPMASVGSLYLSAGMGFYEAKDYKDRTYDGKPVQTVVNAHYYIADTWGVNLGYTNRDTKTLDYNSTGDKLVAAFDSDYYHLGVAGKYTLAAVEVFGDAGAMYGVGSLEHCQYTSTGSDCSKGNAEGWGKYINIGGRVHSGSAFLGLMYQYTDIELKYKYTKTNTKEKVKHKSNAVAVVAGIKF